MLEGCQRGGVAAAPCRRMHARDLRERQPSTANRVKPTAHKCMHLHGFSHPATATAPRLMAGLRRQDATSQRCTLSVPSCQPFRPLHRHADFTGPQRPGSCEKNIHVFRGLRQGVDETGRAIRHAAAVCRGNIPVPMVTGRGKHNWQIVLNLETASKTWTTIAGDHRGKHVSSWDTVAIVSRGETGTTAARFLGECASIGTADCLPSDY